MRVSTVRNLGWAIRGARQHQGLNQQDLATATGVSRQWISTVEAGTSNPGLRQVLIALDALNLTLRVEDASADRAAHPKPAITLDEILDVMDRATEPQ